jgi:hypothetical protein
MADDTRRALPHRQRWHSGCEDLQCWNARRQNERARGRHTRAPLHALARGQVDIAHVDRIVSHIDLFPTLLDLCDDRKLRRSQGRWHHAASTFGKGSTTTWPERTLFTHNPIRPDEQVSGAVRTQKHRLVREIKGPAGGSKAQANDASATPWQLYDMETDPGQSHDIAAEHPDLVKQLSAQYDAWFSDISSGGLQRFPLPVGHAEHNPVELHAPQAFLIHHSSSPADPALRMTGSLAGPMHARRSRLKSTSSPLEITKSNSPTEPPRTPCCASAPTRKLSNHRFPPPKPPRLLFPTAMRMERHATATASGPMRKARNPQPEAWPRDSHARSPFISRH